MSAVSTTPNSQGLVTRATVQQSGPVTRATNRLVTPLERLKGVPSGCHAAASSQISWNDGWSARK